MLAHCTKCGGLFQGFSPREYLCSICKPKPIDAPVPRDDPENVYFRKPSLPIEQATMTCTCEVCGQTFTFGEFMANGSRRGFEVVCSDKCFDSLLSSRMPPLNELLGRYSDREEVIESR